MTSEVWAANITVSYEGDKLILTWPSQYDVYAPFITLSPIGARPAGLPGPKAAGTSWIIPAKNRIHLLRFFNRLTYIQQNHPEWLEGPLFAPEQKVEAKGAKAVGYNFTYLEMQLLLALSGGDDLKDVMGPLPKEGSDSSDEFLALLTEYMQRKVKGLRRGDVVALYDRYRNDDTYIYDGRTLVRLDDEMDDYGHVPASFPAITEFPPDYWAGVIDHNSYVYVDTSKLQIKRVTTFKDLDGETYDYGENADAIGTVEAEYTLPGGKPKTYTFTTGLLKVVRDPTRRGHTAILDGGARRQVVASTIETATEPVDEKVLTDAFRRERWFSAVELGDEIVLAMPDTMNGVVGGPAELYEDELPPPTPMVMTAVTATSS